MPKDVSRREASFIEHLEHIGQQIGYGRAQQLLGDLWDEMLDRNYPPRDGLPSRSSRGRMGVTVQVHVGEVVIGPSPIDGSESFTMIRWNRNHGCPPVGTRLYVEKLNHVRIEGEPTMSSVNNQYEDAFVDVYMKSDGTIYHLAITATAHHSRDRIAELKMILQRALQTLEPEKTPQWASDLLDVLNGVK